MAKMKRVPRHSTEFFTNASLTGTHIETDIVKIAKTVPTIFDNEDAHLETKT